MRMQGQVILVTGGASGIGLATVKRALEDGASVIMADLATSEGAERAAHLDTLHPGKCRFVAVDVSSTADVDAMIGTALQNFGRIDGVFNNAGIGGMSPATDYADEDFLRIIDINLNGVFRVARASLKVMYGQGSGSIVNCASILGVFGQSMTAAYSAAKGGVVNLTRTLSLEAAPHGVRVNAIGPGYIDTPLLSAVDDDMMKALVSLHPLGRLGRPEEVASAALFLMSTEASFITGAHMMVDGGFTAGKS